MKKKICPTCKGTGLSNESIGSNPNTRFNCPNCGGTGFILSDSSNSEDFKGKKFVDGMEYVYLRHDIQSDNLHVPIKTIMLGCVPYKDFLGGFTTDDIKYFPDGEKICPAEYQKYGTQLKDCINLPCSCNKKISARNCPFLDFQKNKKIVSYCWNLYNKSVEEGLKIELTKTEQELLNELLNAIYLIYDSRILNMDKITIYFTYLVLKKKLNCSMTEDMFFDFLGIPKKPAPRSTGAWTFSEALPLHKLHAWSSDMTIKTDD